MCEEDEIRLVFASYDIKAFYFPPTVFLVVCPLFSLRSERVDILAYLHEIVKAEVISRKTYTSKKH